MKTITVIPTYNEKENIGQIVPIILNSMPGASILIVDDNSPDGTGELADLLSQKYKNQVFVLHRGGKDGLGQAYIAGFKWALDHDYEIITQMDADFSHNPKNLPAMLEEIKNHDLIIGSRYIHGGGVKNWGLKRKLLSRGGSLYAKIILGLPINDVTGGFKCWRADLLKKIGLDSIFSGGFSFQIEMNARAHQAGARIKEIPIIFADRIQGQSKMSQRIILEAIKKVWEIKFNR